jgi:hypothetical protein
MTLGNFWEYFRRVGTQEIHHVNPKKGHYDVSNAKIKAITLSPAILSTS